MSLHIPRPRLTPQMRQLFRRMAPGLLGSGVIQLNLAVDAFIAGLLPAGTVSVIYYADRINQLPLGVIGAAVGTTLLPTLSRQVHGSTPEEAVGTLNRALEYALMITLPAALALLVAALPIISSCSAAAHSPRRMRRARRNPWPPTRSDCRLSCW